MKVALFHMFSSDYLIREGSSHDRHLERGILFSRLFTLGQNRKKRALKSPKQQLIKHKKCESLIFVPVITIHKEEFTQGN